MEPKDPDMPGYSSLFLQVNLHFVSIWQLRRLFYHW